ncbi:N-6 DNA methylase [Paenibacillus sp. FSL R5-0527]|uniref:N-6 DNA methylase n=1 Tax=Paenibacillus sp. FSL R5-0527 TaxID=2975321 RepID=UPI00097ABCAB|nr:hypothetical protein BK140_09260 [Paenibacillus macerans]
MVKSTLGLTTYQKRFVDTFQRLSYKQQSWQVWSDFILMAACAISNRFDRARYDEREQQYLERIARYDEKEQKIFQELLSTVVEALDADPEQDFLGNLFMQLELGSHWKGQFFTPYSLCRAMGEMQAGDIKTLVECKGYISVNDPACGAGALLIAFANAARSKGVNYQNHVLFVAQDIDQTAALMCYIQLSLLGCAGYVVIGDTLSQPATDNLDGRDVWYTPLYFSDVWHWRRTFKKLDELMKAAPEPAPDVIGKPERTAKLRKRTKEIDKPIQLTLF